MSSDSPATAPGGATLDVRGIRRSFRGGLVAIDGVDLHITPGEFVAVLGPSGCGKSTLLRIIAGLDKPDSGSIQTGFDAAAHRRLAYVFQDAHLLPWRDTLRNVALPLELRGVPRREGLTRAAAAVEQVGLTGAAALYPAQLSGGMRMRVSLARALVTDPALLLLDEPFAALDEITRQQLDEQLRALWWNRRMTVIFVTHSIIEATFLAERALVLTPRPARVALDCRLELPEQRGAALRTEAGFARQMRVLFEALERAQGRVA